MRDLARLPDLLMQWRAAHVMQLEAIDRMLEALRPEPAQASPTPTVPASEPVECGAGSGKITSPERDAIIRHHWPLGTPVGEIAAQVNALPGREMSNGRLGVRANELGVKRPLGYTGATKVAAKGAPSAATLPNPPGDPLPPVVTELDVVAGWAVENGFKAPVMLGEVNAARHRLGLPPFVLDKHPIRRLA